METLHPGLYFQEVSGSQPVEGVSTSTAGFIGVTYKGAVGEPVLVTNWNQFVTEFGGFINDSYLAYAVRGFFENGGTRAYIVRAVHYENDANGVPSPTSKIASKDFITGDSTVVMTVNAKNGGAWGNKIAIKIDSGKVENTFDMTVYYSNEVVETYKNLTMDVVEAETKDSKYIEVITFDGSTIPDPIDKTRLTGGADGTDNIGDNDYIISLNAFDTVNVNLLAIPGVSSQAVHKALYNYCSNRKDVFAILDTPMEMSVTDVEKYVNETANLSTDFGAFYYPYILVSDPIGIGKNPTKLVPPSGHVMGVMTRIDNSSGVWKAPAGTDAQVAGAIGLEYNVSDAEQDILNPEGINCIRSLEGSGICVWGARTLSSGEYKYIPVRRLVIFIEQSLKSNMLWTVFKPNDEKLWGMIRSSVSSFLNSIWAQGGLKGESASEAFFVKCDGEINTEDVIDLGRTYVDIGIAPQKPAEFIIFRISLNR